MRQRDSNSDARQAFSRNSDEAAPRLNMDPAPGKKRQEYKWSPPARELVRSNLHPSSSELRQLITKLVHQSGNPRHACLRFVRRMGVASQVRRRWSEADKQAVVRLMEKCSAQEVAKIMQRSEASVYHALSRSRLSKENRPLSKTALADALHVRPVKVQEWIDSGILRVRLRTRESAMSAVFPASEFFKFQGRDTCAMEISEITVEISLTAKDDRAVREGEATIAAAALAQNKL